MQKHKPVDSSSSSSKKKRRVTFECGYTEKIIKIQKIWRKKFKYNVTRRLVEEFMTGGPTIEHVKSIR